MRSSIIGVIISLPLNIPTVKKVFTSMTHVRN